MLSYYLHLALAFPLSPRHSRESATTLFSLYINAAAQIAVYLIQGRGANPSDPGEPRRKFCVYNNVDIDVHHETAVGLQIRLSRRGSVQHYLCILYVCV